MFQVSCFKCCSHLNPETWNLVESKRVSAAKRRVGSIAGSASQLMTVLLARDIAHVDEGRVDDELVEVNLWLSDNESEGLDEKLS